MGYLNSANGYGPTGNVNSEPDPAPLQVDVRDAAPEEQAIGDVLDEAFRGAWVVVTADPEALAAGELRLGLHIGGVLGDERTALALLRRMVEALGGAQAPQEADWHPRTGIGD